MSISKKMDDSQKKRISQKMKGNKNAQRGKKPITGSLNIRANKSDLKKWKEVAASKDLSFSRWIVQNLNKASEK